jgi:hypothetical protein
MCERLLRLRIQRKLRLGILRYSDWYLRLRREHRLSELESDVQRQQVRL